MRTDRLIRYWQCQHLRWKRKARKHRRRMENAEQEAEAAAVLYVKHAREAGAAAHRRLEASPKQ